MGALGHAMLNTHTKKQEEPSKSLGAMMTLSSLLIMTALLVMGCGLSW